MFSLKFRDRGFTLLEFLLVMALIGMLLALLLPRFQRATDGARFAEVRQKATEIASFINEWTSLQVQAQLSDTSLTAKDFLSEEIYLTNNNFRSRPLLNHYTGNDNFNGVEGLISPDDLPRNPFNQASYFNRVNDFVRDSPEPGRRLNPGPSPNPGLIYLTSFREIQSRSSRRKFRFFYLIFTGISAGSKKRSGIWYGAMDDKIVAGIRKGVLVNRYPDIPYRPQTEIRRRRHHND